MDLQSLSRVQNAGAVPSISARTSCRVQPNSIKVSVAGPSAASAKNLGVKFSSLNGKSITDVVGTRGGRRKNVAQGSKPNLKVRAEAVQDTASPVQTLPRIPGKETLKLKGELRLSRTIGLNTPPEIPFYDFQRNIWFTLVSTKLKGNSGILSARAQLLEDCEDTDEFYAIEFEVPSDFGEPGALVVESKNLEEFYLELIKVNSADSSSEYEFATNSWINHKHEENYKTSSEKAEFVQFFGDEIYNIARIFFTNKVYLPDDTPSGLQMLRNIEKESLRGDGTGKREAWDRIYDYDVYNDLGHTGHPSPTFGGSNNIKYPRRCRTGREVDKETGAEANVKQGEKAYVPRDEDFSRVKDSGFQADSLNGLKATLLPIFQATFDETPDDFDSFLDIFNIYKNGLNLLPRDPNLQLTEEEKKDVLAFYDKYVFKVVGGIGGDLNSIRYPTPQVLEETVWEWMDDEEFGRQTLAGMNPVVITRVKVFPPQSSLPEDLYGPATALTEKCIEPFLRSKGKSLTVSEAIAAKRLFSIDYHDVYTPYVNKINSQTDKPRRIYASRAFFFLTDDHKMKPVAIELSLPPPQQGANHSSNRVFTPAMGPNQHNLKWELAKLHFASVDFGYHELVSHWLKSHAVMEPFIIASHRQLSAMHPIFVLLDPSFVNTMRINANARNSLISGGGTIETNFTPGKYGNEMSAIAYEKLWRFDKVALPADLLDRGMAEEDPKNPGHVKLVFDDYPFAKDALEVWNVTKEYVTNYVRLFYSSDEAVKQDVELQAWWKELREVGHADKKDEPWWPSCQSVDSLVDILTNVFWIAGPHHAAVNFGQYAYAGFMPNRPPMTRLFIPKEGTPEHKEMCFNFESYMLKLTSTPQESVTVMTTLNVLSSHAKDEEYIGERLHSNWTSNPQVKEVFKKYAEQVDNLQLMFAQRNNDKKYKNRHGALKKVGYTLMYPKSEPGVTGKGVPWSISI